MEIEIRESSRKKEQKLKVCAYCRVSTDAEEQENSLENQISHYKEFIQSNTEYEYAGVYYDFATSGFKEMRPGLQKMLSDARSGKIDLILTKSVSRFARNTNIILKATRELRELNVGIFFELQNIHTLSGEGELMLSIIAAFAQAESESVSIGAKMVYQRKYEQGIPVQYLERSFGYKKNQYGEFEPKKHESVWVKKIYEMAAAGYTPAAIKRYLNENDVKTVEGVAWLDSTVFRLLQNEIYKGDYIMHKHYVNEERKLVKNRGQVDSWYIQEDHKGIVSPELWQKAQDALKRKSDYLAKGSEVEKINAINYPYKNKLFCAECGYPLYPRVYSNGNRMNWGCSGQKRYGKGFCQGINVQDGIIKQWDFEGNIYIRLDSKNKGYKEFSFLKESSWKRRHKKKAYVRQSPAKVNMEDYPYYKSLHCASCGHKLVRCVNTQNHKVTWICSGNKHYSSSFCRGVRIPDQIVREWNISGDIYIEGKVMKNGEKRYSYSSNKPTIGR